MFDVDALVADLEAAVRDTDPRLATKEVLARALARPAEVAAARAPRL